MTYPLIRQEPFYPGQLGVHGSDVPRGMRWASEGNVFWVNNAHPDNSDAHDGTDPEHPLTTITQALANCTANGEDFVIVQNFTNANETWPIAITKSKVHLLCAHMYFGGRIVTPPADTAAFYITGDRVEVAGFDMRPLLEGWARRLYLCTECGRCKDACPTFLTGKPLAQKWVHDSIKHHLLERRDAILTTPTAEAPEALPSLVPGVIAEDTLWACTTCGYCESACPIELEHLPKFYRLRQQRVMMEGAFPHELKALFDAYESQSNPWGLPSDTRGDWARSLGIPVVSSPEAMRDHEWLYYVGSAASFDPRGQKIATAFATVLRHAGVRFAILGAAETSTGECVRRLGNEMADL